MEFSFLISDLRKSVPGADRLSGLSGDELLAALREFLGDAAAGADLRVDGDVVTVSLAKAPPSRAEEAERLYRKAGGRARTGEFDKAQGIYRRVLELDPSRHDARRDLAMVLVEMGQTEEAKGFLLDVLRTDPTNAACLVILGNHYAKVERDLETAERFFRRAVEVSPEVATAHNSLAGMLFEKGQPEAALAEFDKALELQPDFPQPRYGRAMIYLDQGRLAEAKRELEELFAQADLKDSRHGPMLASARQTYLKFANIAANDSAEQSAAAAEECRTRVATISGFPAAVSREELPNVMMGSTQTAWRHERDYHRVALAKSMPAEMLFHHIQAHECHHILLEAEARAAGVNRWFYSTDAGIRGAIDAMKGEIRKLARASDRDAGAIEKLEEMVGRMLPDALSLLYNGPLDIVIERRIAEEPRLRDAQFCSLNLQAHNAARIGLGKRSRSIVPRQLLALNDTLNGANALFLDRLFGGATDYFSAYADSAARALAVRVCDLCMESDGGPGSEYGLVDEVAGMLKCKEWFRWRPDPGEFRITHRLEGDPDAGISDPAKLKQNSAPAMQLLLKTLARFDSMTDEAIKRLTLEAALAGESGITFTDATPAHRLESLPGETVSGLEVMCILYAGMKRLNPGVPDAEIGMDLSQEYAAAVEVRRRG